MGVLPSLEYAQEFADTFAYGYNGLIDDVSADIGDINGNILFSKHYPSSKWENHLANDWKKL